MGTGERWEEGRRAGEGREGDDSFQSGKTLVLEQFQYFAVVSV